MRFGLVAALAVVSLTGCTLPAFGPSRSPDATAYETHRLSPDEASAVEAGIRRALTEHPNAAAAELAPGQEAAQFTKIAASSERGALAGAPVNVCARVRPAKWDGSLMHDYLFMGQLLNGQFTTIYSAGLAGDSWAPLAAICRQRSIQM